MAENYTHLGDFSSNACEHPQFLALTHKQTHKICFPLYRKWFLSLEISCEKKITDQNPNQLMGLKIVTIVITPRNNYFHSLQSHPCADKFNDSNMPSHNFQSTETFLCLFIIPSHIVMLLSLSCKVQIHVGN